MKYQREYENLQDVDIFLLGHPEVMRRLTSLQNIAKHKKHLQQMARQSIQPMLGPLRKSAPYKTGTLRKSLKIRILSKKDKSKIGMKIYTANVSWEKSGRTARGKKPKSKFFKVYYAKFQEYGTRRGIKSTRWMKKIAKAYRNQVLESYVTKVLDYCRKLTT